MERKRVVITGMGVISCVGLSIQSYWENLIKGQSGIRIISLFDANDLPCQIAGEAHDFDPLLFMDRKTARRTPRSTQMALASARQAFEDAQLASPMTEPERVGVYFGTAVGGLDNLTSADHIYR